MIFDELWRAERRTKKKAKRIKETYLPLLEAAKKEDEEKYQSTLADFFFESDLNDEAASLRTDRLVKRARKLGIPIPAKPNPWATDPVNNVSWEFNSTTGNFYLSDKAELELTREVRKEELERLQHQMRWVSQVIIPLIGLIGAIMGLISLIHSLK